MTSPGTENSATLGESLHIVRESFLGLPVRVAAVLSLAFILAHVFYAISWRNAPLSIFDTTGYLAFAKDLLDGRIDLLHARTPGYPVLLVLTGSSEIPTRLLFHVSLLLHFLSIWMLAVLLHAAKLPSRALLVFSLFLLTPPYVQTAGYAATEMLAQFLLVLGFFSLGYWSGSPKPIVVIVSGLAFATSALTRPAYQAIGLPLAGLLIWLASVTRAKSLELRSVLLPVGLFVGSILIPLGAYSVFNVMRHDYFGITYALGFNLTTKTARFVQELPPNYAEVRDILLQSRNMWLIRNPSPGSQSVYWYAHDAFPLVEHVTGKSGVDLADYFLHLNLELIRSAPMAYLQQVVESLAGHWFPYVTELASFNSAILFRLWNVTHLILMLVFFAQVIVFVGVGVYVLSRRVRETQPESWLLKGEGLDAIHVWLYAGGLTIIFYTAVVSSLIDTGEPRQRVCIDIFIVFAVFLGFYLWRRCGSVSDTLSLGR